MRAHDVATSSRPDRGRLVVAVLCAVSAVLYATWLTGVLVNPGVDELYGYVSELSARDQPGSVVFRAGDATAGALALCAAVLAVGRRPRARMPGAAAAVATLVGWGGLALFGAATTVDATLTPMDCATFTDTGCALREAFGTSTMAHQLHAISSTLAGAGALVGMAALGLAARHGVARLPAPSTALALSTITLAATLATLLALMLGGWAGLFQRIQLAAVSAWLLALAVASWRGASRAGAAS